MGATWTSSRIARDGISTADKASSLASIRDTIQGITSSIPFTVLNSVPVSAMQSIMVDLDIVVDNVEEQLRGFRAEELARAAIAEDNYKNYVDEQKEKYVPQEGEDWRELSMEVIWTHSLPRVEEIVQVSQM